MKAKKIFAYLLVLVLIFSQSAMALASIQVNFGDISLFSNGDVTVANSVYSDTQEEADGKIVSYDVYDNSGNVIYFGDSQPISGSAMVYSVPDAVYSLNVEDLNFNDDFDSTVSYTVYASIDGQVVGSRTYDLSSEGVYGNAEANVVSPSDLEKMSVPPSSIEGTAHDDDGSVVMVKVALKYNDTDTYLNLSTGEFTESIPVFYEAESTSDSFATWSFDLSSVDLQEGLYTVEVFANDYMPGNLAGQGQIVQSQFTIEADVIPTPNPEFMINVDQDNYPDYNADAGMYVYSGFQKDANIDFLNTGIDAGALLIDGTTSYNYNGEQHNIDFVLTFNRPGEPDSYHIDAHFEDESLNNYNTRDNLPGQEGAYRIPVKVLVENTITIRYIDSQTGDTVAEEAFKWIPEEEQGGGAVWDGTDIDIEATGDSISENPEIYVNIYGFTGEQSNLRLELLYSEVDQYGNPITPVLIAALTDVSLVSEDASNNSKKYLFRLSEGDENSLSDAQYNDRNLNVNLRYEDSVNGINDENNIGGLRLDNQAPNNDDIIAEYYGVDEETGYTKIVVHFNDIVDWQSLTQSNFILTKADETTSSPLTIAVADIDADRSALLYFESVESGDILTVSGVEDVVGHVMDGSKDIPINTEVEVRGTLLDSSGEPITEAGIDLVRVDDIPEEITEDTMIEMRHVNTDPAGNFIIYLKAGSYRIFRIIKGSPEDMDMIGTDIDMEVPASGSTYNVTLTVPEPNVQGSVKRLSGLEYTEKLVFVETEYEDYQDWMIHEMFGRSVETNEDGTFQLYLKPGTYTLEGKASGFAFIPPVSPIGFIVPDNLAEGQMFDLDAKVGQIEFPAMNVSGTIHDSDGNPVQNAMVLIMPTGESSEGGDGDIEEDGMEGNYSAMTDENGEFITAVPNGDSYAIMSVLIMDIIGQDSQQNGGMYFTDVQFDVTTEGAVTNVTGSSISGGTTLDNIVLHDPNLRIGFKQGGSQVTDHVGVDVVINMPEGQGPQDMRTWIGSSTGLIDLYLPAGTIKINGADIVGMWVDNLDYEIEIEPGASLKEEIIDLAADSNVVVSVQNEDGTGLENVGVSIEGKQNHMFYWRNTDDSGNIYLNLEPGVYRISGYDEAGVWHEYDYEFEVTDEYTSNNRLEITIVQESPNVKGYVYLKDDNGNDIEASNVNVSLKKLPGEGETVSQFIGFNTNGYGYFELNLDPGEYVVEGVWNHMTQTWTEFNFRFFVDEDGNVRLTEDGDVKESIEIRKEADNVQGYVFKSGTSIENGVPYLGDGTDDDTFVDVWLVVRDANVDDKTYFEQPWMYENWISVKKDGSFSKTLDPNKTYVVWAVVDAGNWIDLASVDNPTIFTPPVTDLLIVPPAPNFYGVVKNFDGTSMGKKGWLNLESVDSSRWIGMEISEDGSFGKNIKGGSEYVIREAVFFEDDSRDWQSATVLSFNKTVTVGENTENIVLKPNLKGTINLSGMLESNGQQVGISILPKLEEVAEGEPGYDKYIDMMQNPWKYEKRVDLTEDENSPGLFTFTTYLEEGNYVIAGASSPNGWVELRIPFALDKENSVEAQYDSDNDNYTLTLDFQPNVQGIIKDTDGSPVANAWVNILKHTEDEQELMPGQMPDPDNFFGASTDSDGVFKLKLDAGSYRLEGYHTQGYWYDNVWMPGAWVDVGYEFTVEEGKDVSITVQPNLTAKVMKIFADGEDNPNNFIGTPVDGEYAQLRRAWILVKPADDDYNVDWSNHNDTVWANSDESGMFKLMLSDGKYKVIEAGGEDFWMKAGIPFEVSGGSIVDGQYVENGVLVIKPKRPNLSGVAYRDVEKQQPAEWGWISVKPASDEDYDWSHARWIKTEDGGSFEDNLDPGEWKIIDIGGPNYWIRLNIPITITEDENGNTTITSTVPGVVQDDGTLVISPPLPNVEGIVKDKNGNTISSEAWINFKPADASKYDWSNAFHAQYSDVDGDGVYGFAIYVPDGNYKVVNVGGEGFWYETNVRFDVVNGQLTEVTSGSVVNGKLIVAPPTPNVSGTLYGTVNGSEEVLANGWIGIARLADDGTQLTIEGEAIPDEEKENLPPGEDIAWQYTRWAPTDEGGGFELNLPEGTFKVIAANGQASDGGWLWFNPKQEFTVSQSGTTTLEVRQPAPNVTVTVKNSGASEQEAWIDVQFIKGNGEKVFVPVIFKEKTDSGDYVFQGNLESGSYEVIGFGTPSMWEEIGQEFTVESDASVNVPVDFNALSKIRVSGTVQNQGAAMNEKVWVAIQPVVNGILDTDADKVWRQTDTEGNFTFKLNTGEEWAITDISSSLGYKTITNPLNYSHEVGASDEQANEWQIDIADLD